MYKYFNRISGVGSGNQIYFWKSEGLSHENATAPTITDYSLNLQLSYLSTKTRVTFKGSYLKLDKITYDHGKIVNIYIVYEINKNVKINSYPTLENWLFDAVSLTKNHDIVKCEYSGYRLDLVDIDFFHTLVVELMEM